LRFHGSCRALRRQKFDGEVHEWDSVFHQAITFLLRFFFGGVWATLRS